MSTSRWTRFGLSTRYGPSWRTPSWPRSPLSTRRGGPTPWWPRRWSGFFTPSSARPGRGPSSASCRRRQASRARRPPASSTSTAGRGRSAITARSPREALSEPLHRRRRDRHGLRSAHGARHERDPPVRLRALPASRLDLQRTHLRPEEAADRRAHGPADPLHRGRHRHAPQADPPRAARPLRVEPVHLGDREGEKGSCVLNVNDEVTRFRYLGAVSNVTEYFLTPVLTSLLTSASPLSSRPSTPITAWSRSTTVSPRS